MSKFTQGEWKYLEWPMSFSDKTEQWYLVGSAEHAIGFIRQEEDAKLIAAAPEMYRLIVDALEMCKGREVYASLYTRAVKLIARIDGKEQTEYEPA